MQIGALNRSIWAGCALLAALACASAQAAPQSREDTASTDTSAADDNDTSTAAAGAAIVSPATPLPNQAAMAPAATNTAKTASAPVAQDRDMGRSIREVSKPMLEELAHSDVAEAVRALDTNKTGAVDAGLDQGSQDEDSADPGARRRNWDGSGQRQARENNAQQAAANRDPERDKARAAMLMSGLIDEIKPWALGAAVLYVLAYVAKFSLAARRRTVQRRMERRKYNRRTPNSQNNQNSQNSQHGRP